MAGKSRHYRACECKMNARAGKTREYTAAESKLNSGAGKRRGNVAVEFRMRPAVTVAYNERKEHINNIHHD